MEPVTTAAAASKLLQWAPIAVNAAGSAISALGGAKQGRDERRQNERQYKRQERLNYAGMDQNERQFGYNANMQRGTILDGRAQAAAAVQDRLNRAPVADQAQYLIQQRLGMAPGAFQGRDITRGGTAQFYGSPTGGVAPIQDEMQRAAGRYTAGMGGVDTSYLTAARDRFADESLLPGEYQAQTGGQMRLTAMRDELLQAMQADRRPEERAKYARRIAELDRMIGAAGSGGDVASQISIGDQDLEQLMAMIRDRALGPAVNG